MSSLRLSCYLLLGNARIHCVCSRRADVKIGVFRAKTPTVAGDSVKAGGKSASQAGAGHVVHGIGLTIMRGCTPVASF